MGGEKLGKHYDGAGDSPEQIDMCMRCCKPECNDCIGNRAKLFKMHNPDSRVIGLWMDGLTDGEIGDVLGMSAPTVRRHRLALELPSWRVKDVSRRKLLVASWLREHPMT